MPYTVAGSTVHFTVQYDSAMGSPGLAVANDILATCEGQMETLRNYFSGLSILTVPITVQIENASGGATNNGTNFIDISALTDSYQAQFLLVAELAEIFMRAQGTQWNPVNSKGEGLSRALAELAYPFAGDVPNMYAYPTVYFWLNNGRPDFVSTTFPSDTNPSATGCSILFIYYLAFQLGLPLSAIIASPAPTLLGIYAQLVGGTGGFAQFLSLADAAFPRGVTVSFTIPENPFPIGGNRLPATLGANIINPALRIAGITTLPGTTPSVDQTGELIPAVNRLLGSWNVDGAKIFNTLIQQFALIGGKKQYTIGPGGELDTRPGNRPVWIEGADFVLPGTPAVRIPMRILRTAKEWESIWVQDITASPAWALYYDSGYDSAGLGLVHIIGQPPPGYFVELYMWNRLSSNFLTTGDAFILPDGYEEALVYNLAVRAATLYPGVSKIAPDSVALAAKLARGISVMNQKSPLLTNDAAALSVGEWSGQQGGMFIAGGGTAGGGDVQLTFTGAINGTTGADGNSVFMLNITPTSNLLVFKNGLLQTVNISYRLAGNLVTFIAPNIPVSGDTLDMRGS